MIATLLVAWVLAPLLAYGSQVLDDTRLDSGVLGLLALVLVAASWHERMRLRSLPGLGAWLGAAIIALLALTFQDRAWSEVVGGLADRAVWFSAGVTLLIATHFRKDLAGAWTGIFTGLSIAAWIAVLQLLGLDLLGLKPAEDAPPTGFASNRPQASEIGTVFVLAFLGWKRPSTLGLWLAWIAPAALMSGYLDSTAARLALATGLGFLLLRERTTFLVPAALVAALFVVGETVRVVVPPPFATQEEGEAGLQDWASVEGRIHMYSAGLNKAARSPLGLGYGRFEIDYPEWRPLAEQRLSASNYENVATRRPKTPHSEPLLVLLEFGWLGTTLIGFGLLRMLRDPNRARWTDAALLALGAHTLVRSPLSDHGVLLALAVLLLAARRDNQAMTPAPATERTFVWPLALLVAALGMLPAPSQIGGELAVARRLPLDEKKPIEIIESAVAWRPWDTRALGILSVDRSQATEPTLQGVRNPLLEALRHDPSDLFALNQLFILDTKRGQSDLGLIWLMRSEQIAPEHPAVRTNRTLLQREVAEFHRIAGTRMLAEHAPGAHQHLLLSQLWTAMAETRNSEIRKAQQALRAAAVYSQTDRALIERIAREEKLSESMVRALVERLAPPDQHRYLGRLATEAGEIISTD
ncbi:MAG: O-antigen ligase family protein [Planctomycetes bacterium]|nr:O-antigen ligase family protein [Planctomycetota bacterium]